MCVCVTNAHEAYNHTNSLPLSLSLYAVTILRHLFFHWKITNWKEIEPTIRRSLLYTMKKKHTQKSIRLGTDSEVYLKHFKSIKSPREQNCFFFLYFWQEEWLIVTFFVKVSIKTNWSHHIFYIIHFKTYYKFHHLVMGASDQCNPNPNLKWIFNFKMLYFGS